MASSYREVDEKGGGLRPPLIFSRLPDRRRPSRPYKTVNFRKYLLKSEILASGMSASASCQDMRSMLRNIASLPGRKLASRAANWPDCHREDTEIGPPAGRRPAGGPISVFSPVAVRPKSGPEGRFPVRKHDCVT